jgi:hypothetical protein
MEATMTAATVNSGAVLMGASYPGRPRVVWQPQPKQVAFMQRPEYEALMGGAAGGGKSDALIAEALRQVHIPHYRAVIIRKTFPQLTDLIDKSQRIYSAAFPRARYVDNKKVWLFPSGAKIYFASMQHETDRFNFQGKAYDFIGFDELTHFSWDEYSFLMSRNRPSGPGTRVYIRATCNPGGKGHGWVKDRFVTPAPPMTPIVGEYTIYLPNGMSATVRRRRVFVPATVFDNRALLQNDPNYITNLAMLPEAERNAYLYGSWDSFSGQVFREWVDDPAHYADRRWTHVIDPFPVPDHWTIYRGFDFGYARPFSVGWYAVDGRKRKYRIAEYYGCDGEPNRGVQLTPQEIAANIRRIEAENPNLKGRRIFGIADPSIFDESRGESIAAMMESSPNFVFFEKGDNTRLAGKMQMHYHFAFDEDGLPMFQVFNTCKHFIRTIPGLVYDEKHVEDVDSKQEDHIYDECRYVLMANPIPARRNVLQKPVPLDDPLNMYKSDWSNKQGRGDMTFYQIY